LNLKVKGNKVYEFGSYIGIYGKTQTSQHQHQRWVKIWLWWSVW